jgi:hypothetical protein
MGLCSEGKLVRHFHVQEWSIHRRLGYGVEQALSGATVIMVVALTAGDAD